MHFSVSRIDCSFYLNLCPAFSFADVDTYVAGGSLFLGRDRGSTQDPGPGGARQRHKVYVGDRTETPPEEAGHRRPQHQARHVSLRLTHIGQTFVRLAIFLIFYKYN